MYMAGPHSMHVSRDHNVLFLGTLSHVCQTCPAQRRPRPSRWTTWWTSAHVMVPPAPTGGAVSSSTCRTWTGRARETRCS